MIGLVPGDLETDARFIKYLSDAMLQIADLRQAIDGLNQTCGLLPPRLMNGEVSV